MRIGSRNFIVAAGVLVVMLAGCSTGDQMAKAGPGDRMAKAGPGMGSGPPPGVQPPPPCTWGFTNAGNGKPDRATFHFTSNPGNACSLVSANGPLFIGPPPISSMHKILNQTPPAEFQTVGSCRYCYLDSGGGMTCVSYPGNC